MASQAARQAAISKASSMVNAEGASGFIKRAAPAKEKLAPRWLTVDPGEDCGLSIWEENRLILAFTLKMGVVDALFYTLIERSDQIDDFLVDYPECEDVVEQLRGREIVRIVCEDWRLYPWVMYTPDGRASHALDFDQCRTARLIGVLTILARMNGIPFFLQGADIKETAVAGGAENFYYKPLHENRHQNDAIQHGVFYLIIEEKKPPVDARI